MDNFKAFQLTAEEAMNVTGEGRGRRGKRGGRKNFLAGLSEADQTAVKTAITELKAGEGWAALGKTEKRAAIKAVIAPFKAPARG